MAGHGEMNSRRRENPHREVEKLSLFGNLFHMSPGGLHVYAEHYLMAAKTSSSAAQTYAPAKLFLVCHSIELSLKAFLSLRGKSLVELSERYGHRLAMLYDESVESGIFDFVQIEHSLGEEVRKASEYYQEKVFEYPSVPESVRAYPRLPDFEMLLKVAELLVSELKQPCIEH
jgi:hypothetical protein